MRFRLIDLIVLSCVTIMLLGLTAKALQIGTEDVRTAQCVANMAKLAKGVIAYDQAMKYLPPLATVKNHPGWNLRVLPYTGYGNIHALLTTSRLYDKDYAGVLASGEVPVNPYDIGNTNAAGSLSTFSGAYRDWYRFTCATSGGLADAYTKNDGDGIDWAGIHNALKTVTEYRCPTRQPEAVIKSITADRLYVNSLNEARFNSDFYEQSCMRGVTSDYAAGFFHTPAKVVTAQIQDAFTFFPIYSFGTDGEFIGKRSYADMKHKSNVWMFGEKYIPQFALTKDTPIANMWNGGVHRTYTDTNRAFALNSSFRVVTTNAQTPIAVTGDEVKTETDFLSGNGIIRYPSNFDTGEYLWGSHHPGVFNMVSGDGAVQSTNTEIDTAVFTGKWIEGSAVDSVL